MGKIVLITEKPSVADTYGEVLGIGNRKGSNGHTGCIEGYSSALKKNVCITWAFGHLVGIQSPEEHNEDWKAWKKEYLPMIPEPFKYKAMKESYDQFKKIKEIYTSKDVDAIYYAGDSGREGIYIQALIRNQIFKSKPKIEERVVWISSYTDESILKGIKDAKPYEEYQGMIDSGYARAIDDWLIGMNLSRAFTLQCGGYHNAISVGRVMTPTLAMVVQRQAEIDNFVKTSYYGVKADKSLSWKAVEGSRFVDSPLLYNETGFRNKEDAENLAKEFSKDMSLTVSDVKKNKKTEFAPKLFSLTSLQRYCSQKFNLSPAKTLEIAQRLYEGKLTTYPRTDSEYLTTAVQTELKVKFGYNVPNRYVDDSKVTDHYAVIPTFEKYPKLKAESLSGDDKLVYEAVMKRFMDTMKPAFTYEAVAVEYIHSNGEKLFESFRIIIDKGWKSGADEDKSDDISNKPVPAKNSKITVSAFTVNEMETKPPAQMTYDILLSLMEKAGKFIEDEELREQIKTSGIGTPATRAEIIKKLISGGFIEANEKGKTTKLFPTDKGKQTIRIVEKYDETLISPLKTAEMEQQLSEIVDGNLSKETHLSGVCDYLRNTISFIFSKATEKLADNGSASGKSATGNCPKCNGEIAKGKFGYYCKNKCGVNISKVYGHELTDAQIQKLLDRKEISFTAQGKKTIVLPEIIENEYQGKVYYNWKTKSGGTVQTKSSSKSSPKSWGTSKSTDKTTTSKGWGSKK